MVETEAKDVALRRFLVTIVMGIAMFNLFILAFEIPSVQSALIIGYLLLAVAFGALASSRGAAILTAALIPLYQAGYCGATTGNALTCDSELGAALYFVDWMLIMLPMLLGVGLGWSLGLRWRGGSLVHHWSKPREPSVTNLRGE